MTVFRIHVWLALCVAFAGTASAAAFWQTEVPGDSKPLNPAESLATMHVTDGYRIELVAAEPLIEDPVCIAWGPDGRLWVVEMTDYPLGIDDKGEVGKDGQATGGGRIRYLEDTDGDGRYDRSTIFLEGIKFPTSIIAWRDGVVVTAAPEVFFARDTKGDGKADERITLFTGFAEANTQLRVNGLRYGLDHWLYLANGLRSRDQIQSAKTGATLTLGARDLRINPDTGEMDPVSGDSQFGRSRSDDGDWFGVHNSWPVWHYVLEDYDIRRNPHIPFPDPKNAFGIPRNPPIYPRSTFVKEYDHPHRGRLMTSACGLMIYRDDLLFPRGELHALTCEPQHNLVHRLVLRDSGTTFTAERHPKEIESEFLSSEDPWFRPVNLRTGPDGAIWVVDMYRYLIEHPQWMPPDSQEKYRPYYRAGHDRGRIYRILLVNDEPRAIPRLDRSTTEQLVAALDSPNGWQRDIAQQMLIWSNDASAVPHLVRTIRHHTNPFARMHALWTLSGVGRLDSELLVTALSDQSPVVRRQAARLATPREGGEELLDALAALAVDDNAKVRLQAALTLGQWEQPEAGEVLGRISIAPDDDIYLQAAVMVGAVSHNTALVDAVMNASPNRLPPRCEQLLQMALVQNDRVSMARLMRVVLTPRGGTVDAEQLRIFSGWLEALSERGTTIPELAGTAEDDLSKTLQSANHVFATARRRVADEDAPVQIRVASATLLGWDQTSQSEDYERLTGMISPRAPVAVQMAAVRALQRIADDRTPAFLLNKWPSLTPDVRSAVLDSLTSRQPWALALLKGIEEGQIPAAHVDTSHRHTLSEHHDPDVRRQAATIFNSAGHSDRQALVLKYEAALKLDGDANRGRIAFEQVCATCHKIDDLGREVGPNLQSLTDRSPRALLVAVLDPNRAIDPRYIAYQVILDDGDVLLGVLTAETSTSINLITADGKSHTILRSHVESLRATELSLMPEGLDTGIDLQQMADLIEFLRDPIPH